MQSLNFDRATLARAAAVMCIVAGCDSSNSGPTQDDQPDVAMSTDTSEDVAPDVSLAPLTVKVSASPTNGNAPLAVQLACDVEGAEPSELSYLWQIDGANQSAKGELSYTFYTKGDYNVCCTSWRTGTSKTYDGCQVVRVTESADLRITPPKVDGPSEISQGDCVPVSFSVSNHGGAVSDSFENRCVLSPSDKWDETPEQHILLQSWMVDGMLSGQSVTQTIDYAEELCVPDDAPDGQYYLLCKADAADVVGEAVKSDNARFATTFITVDSKLGAKPDITFGKLETAADQVLNWGDKLGYQLSLHNAGESDADKFLYRVYVCGGETWSEDCLVVSEAQIFTLDAGSTVPVIRSWTVPDEFADGTYCLHARADIDDVVAEADEDNNQIVGSNCFQVEFEETLGADLAVTSINCTPTDAVWNGPLLVELEIENQGNVTTAAWDYEVYLGTQSAPTPATSTQLCKGSTCKNQAGLEAGEVRTVQTVVTVPGDLALTNYHCMAKIDTGDAVAETDEGNNFGLFGEQITVKSKAKTDIYVADVTLQPPVVQTAGEVIKVNYKLGNNDFSTAAGVTMCVVLSPDDKISLSGIVKNEDYVIHEQLVSQVRADSKLTDEEKAVQAAGITVKPVLPIELPHHIGTYYVGVIADCDNVLKDETTKTNNSGIAAQQLQVLDPQGGCFEDDMEPNDAKELAQALEAGVTTGLGACNEEDWFTVTVPATNTLVVDLALTQTLSLTPVPYDMDLYLYGPDGKLLDSSENVGDADTVLAFVAPETGDYTIQVKPKGSGHEAHYSLDVQLIPPLDGIDIFPAKVKAGPDITFSGGALFLNWKLVNLGTQPAGPFEVTVYLSADGSLDDSDVVAGTIAIDSLEPTISTDRSDFLILPGDVPGGTYQVILVADSGAVVAEVDEDNNVAVTPAIELDAENPCVDDDFEPNNTWDTATTVPALAEGYSVDGLGVCPDVDDWYKVELEAGQRISATINYIYNSYAGFLYLQLIDPTGKSVLLEGTKAKTADVEIPWVWEAGTYYLRVYNPKKNNKALPYLYDLDVVVEAGNVDHECGTDIYETNNAADDAAVVGCGLKQMNLCTADADWLQFTLPAGDEVTLTLDHVENKLRLRIYDDPTDNPFKTLNGNGSTTVAAPADASATFWVLVERKSFSIPLAPGTFGYSIFFDGVAGIDLTVENVVPMSGSVYQGEDEILSFDVVNQCLDPVETMTYGFYLSEDGTFDPLTDTLVHTAAMTTPIGGKGAVPVSEKFTVPFATPAGTYTVFVVADIDDTVEESNEANNFGSGALQVREICVDDTLEPNNIPQFAEELIEGPYTGLQVCPYDLDWYAIELLPGEELNLSIAFVNDDGDLDLRLYGADNFFEPLVKAFQTNDGEELVWYSETGGTYYIRVNGLSGAANSYDMDVSILAP